MNEFNVKEVELSGINLIEASAGTGKTFSLSILFLRAVLKGIKVENILAVTFTDTAADELKNRIRDFLSEAIKELKKDEGTDNKVIKEIINKNIKNKEDKKRKLEQALLDFNKANISTIHSFARNILNNFFFETGFNPKKEFITDADKITDVVVNDYFRSKTFNDIDKNLIEENFNDIGKSDFKNIIANNYSLPDIKLDSEKKPINDIKKDMFNYSINRAKSIKSEMNVLSFQDLLNDLKEAIESDKGIRIKSTLRNKFKMVFIDEFQDTDQVQAYIFRELFIKGEDNNTVFYIGDPKQAIYSFRGADLNTYLKERDGIPKENIFTMSQNFRTSKELVKSITTIFNNEKIPEIGDLSGPFFNKSINFPIVNGSSSVTPIIKDGINQTSLILWFINKDSEDVILKSVAEKRVIDGICAEILNLINGKQKIDARSVKLSDIAILVKNNKETKIIQNALNKFKIQSVISSSQSVFETDEAKNLFILLNAVIKKNDLSAIKSVLISSLFNWPVSEINRLKDDTVETTKWLEKFSKYNDDFFNKGIYAFFNTFEYNNELFSRLSGRMNGERQITNIKHIVELLFNYEKQNSSSPYDIFKYLTEKIKNEAKTSPEEFEMRISTEGNRVNIMTLHKSKGLEFEIVFLPFLWFNNSPNRKAKTIRYNDKGLITLDLDKGKDKDSKQKYFDETHSENLRLTYVAMTRAKRRCYLAWGKINQKHGKGFSYPLGLSPLAWLLHGINNKDKYKTLTDPLKDIESIFNSIKAHAQFTSAPKIEKNKTILKQEKPDLINLKEEKIFIQTGAWESYGKISYSSISVKGETKKDKKNEPDDDKKSIFTFYKGKDAGNFIHDIFENIDFKENDFKEQIEKSFARSRVGKKDERHEWIDIIEKNIKNVLNCSLLENDNIYLKNIACEDRFSEMEFYFPIKNLSDKKLRQTLIKYKIRCSLKEINGFLNGSIDLVFRSNGKYYIIDWKSNHLGYSSENYSHDNLDKAMTESNYKLQYLIYTAALHKYLVSTIKDYDYDKDFGGVFYIFVRGVEPDKRTGIYFEKPDKQIIEEMTKIFEGGN